MGNTDTGWRGGTGRAALICLFFLISTVSCGFIELEPSSDEPSGEDSQIPATNENLVWADEFNGTQIDRSKWGFETGTGAEQGLNGWGNNELQYYTDRTENARIEMLSTGESVLVIEAREESYGGMDYSSARLLTRDLHSWTYGRIEARMKLPAGQGYWPAFWMLGENITQVGWPASGEIDIMENKGQEPTVIGAAIHFGDPYMYREEKFILSEGSFTDDFHIFAIEWEAEEIRWYVDDRHFATQDDWWTSAPDDEYPAPFDKPFYILLNLAVGGNYPGSPDGSTVFPGRLLVDYVRVYQ